MPEAAVVSFRLGGTDGVSVEAAKWIDTLRSLGFGVRTVAGCPPADVVIAGLGWPARAPVSTGEVCAAVAGVDVVVVENLLSLPLNRDAWRAVAEALRGRPSVLRHHDLPWQRPGWDGTCPPNDAAWTHVTVNDHSRREMAARGFDARCLYNRFAVDSWEGDRAATRERLDLEGVVLLHPVRAIRRKNVPAAVRLAEAVHATYWLTGPPEEGYGGELDAVLEAATCPVMRSSVPAVADAYAAADAVALPSTREGFGNPAIESALARRPLAIGRYPAARELAAFGFRWFDPDEPAVLAAFLSDPDASLLEHNRAVAEQHFALDGLAAEVSDVLERVLP